MFEQMESRERAEEIRVALLKRLERSPTNEDCAEHAPFFTRLILDAKILLKQPCFGLCARSALSRH